MLSISSLDLFKNKRLSEIHVLCQDESPNGAMYRDVLFRSRETLFALFDTYMSITNVDNRHVHIARDQRALFKKILLRREDIQTSSQCWNFFIGLIASVMWNYILVIGKKPEIDDLYSIIPRNNCFIVDHSEWYNAVFMGILPNPGCRGILFNAEIEIGTDEDETRDQQTTTIVVLDGDHPPLLTTKFKKMMYEELISDIQEGMRSGILDARCNVEKEIGYDCHTEIINLKNPNDDVEFYREQNINPFDLTNLTNALIALELDFHNLNGTKKQIGYESCFVIELLKPRIGYITRISIIVRIASFIT